ncbi:hypothetical protein GCM10027610_093200 [Dactylosporangium cerinum]
MPPHDGPVGGDVDRPAGLDELLGLGGAREPADDDPAAGLFGAGEEDLPGVWVRRPGFGVQVVAVVPDGDEAEAGDGGEAGGAGADDDAGCAPGGGEEASVPFRGAERGGQRDVRPGAAEGGGHRGVEAVQVAGVGDDDQRAPPAGERGRGGLGEPGGPVLAGQRGPYGVRVAPVAEGP